MIGGKYAFLDVTYTEGLKSQNFKIDDITSKLVGVTWMPKVAISEILYHEINISKVRLLLMYRKKDWNFQFTTNPNHKGFFTFEKDDFVEYVFSLLRSLFFF